MAEIKEEFQGLYAHGIVEGVDFTVAGNMTDDNGNKVVYGSSINLNFSTIEKISKDVNGIKLFSHAKRNFIIKLACDTDFLASELEKWKSQINKAVHLRLQPTKNSTFKLSEI
jgi:hypothetical protein